MSAIPELEESDSDMIDCDDNGAWEDDDEGDIITAECLCLFCEARFKSEEETFIHCHGAHNFNICALQRRHHLDCFGYIKMINYIRSQVALHSLAIAQAVRKVSTATLPLEQSKCSLNLVTRGAAVESANQHSDRHQAEHC